MSGNAVRPMVFVVFRRVGEILVWVGRDEHGATFHRAVGGGIELGETAAAAAAREVREELGTELRDLRFLGVVEDIFPARGALHHELAMVFAADFADESWYGREAARMLDRPEVELVWRALNDGGDIPLYPAGLVDLLRGSGPAYVPAGQAG